MFSESSLEDEKVFLTFLAETHATACTKQVATNTEITAFFISMKSVFWSVFLIILQFP